MASDPRVSEMDVVSKVREKARWTREEQTGQRSCRRNRVYQYAVLRIADLLHNGPSNFPLPKPVR